LALRLSAFHWRVGGARATKWGSGDHVRRQRTIPRPYREFLRGIGKSILIGILTTNYDLVVEKILGPASNGRLGGFKYCDDEEALTGRHSVSSRWTYGPVKITGRVPLLKLHGSLNWAVESGNKIVKYIDARPSRGRRYSALIGPPEGSERRHLLDEIWHNAGRVLRQANIWIFCGYSLPDYDHDVLQLIRANAAMDQRVIVMDQAPKAVCGKLQAILESSRIVVGPPLTADLTWRHITSALSAIA
jgi:SIR2-like domain